VSEGLFFKTSPDSLSPAILPSLYIQNYDSLSVCSRQIKVTPPCGGFRQSIVSSLLLSGILCFSRLASEWWEGSLLRLLISGPTVAVPPFPNVHSPASFRSCARSHFMPSLQVFKPFPLSVPPPRTTRSRHLNQEYDDPPDRQCFLLPIRCNLTAPLSFPSRIY